MKVFFSDSFQYNCRRRAVIALGAFDGMHLGHQILFHKLHSLSSRYNQKSMVYTFLNHPMDVICRSKKPPLLMTVNEKVKAFFDLGLDYAAIVPFTKKFASLPYNEFILKLLSNIPIGHIVVGYNFTFGYKGEGNVRHLMEMGRKHCFQVHVIPPVKIDGSTVSSTRIRACIEQGDIGKSNQLLGRPYELYGRIIHGKEIGRTLGFPTANLSLPHEKIIPRPGVYITLTELDGLLYPSLSNIGTNPTVTHDGDINIETHILDFRESIYGQSIRIHFLHRIRDEIFFNNLQELSYQIDHDVQRTREYFRTRRRVPFKYWKYTP